MKSSVAMAGALVAVLLGTCSARPLKEKRALVTEVVYVTEVADTVVVYVDEDGQPYSTATEAKVTSVSSVSSVASVASVVVSTTSSEAVSPTPSSAGLSTFAWPTAPVFQFTSVQKDEAPLSLPAFLTRSKKVKPTSTPPPAEPTSETTLALAVPSPAPSSSAAPSPEPSSFAAPSPEPLSSPAPSPTPSSGAAPSPTPINTPKPTDDSGVLGMGITYDPFDGSGTNTHCKSEDEIGRDFERMKDYKAVRLYGQGCDQIPLAVRAALLQNQKLMAGTFMSNGQDGEDLDASIRAWKSAIDNYAGGNWDVVSLFSVENERVNEHDMTASAVVDAINRARELLRAAGYNGPVGAVETVPAMVDNPAICAASDVVMVNCHAFFDTNTAADGAGRFVRSEIERVGNACGGKRVVVTESGWPHQGDPNGEAIASDANQKTALESIRAEFSNDMFLHHAFDAMWKSDSMATFNAERFWGIIR